MADKAKNVVLNFKMDGQVQYAKTLKEINAVMNTAAKEYKNHIAAMGNDASATDKLRAEKKKLEIQMDAAQKRTGMLRAEYDAMAKDTNTTTEQLTKMYGKLLDAENAETKLQQSLKRVNDGLSEQTIEAREAQTTLSNLKDDSAKLEAEQQKLTSAFNLQNSELAENATEAQKVELAQQQLRQQMSLTDRTMDNLEKQLEATKKAYGENSKEAMQMESKLNEARTTVNKFKKSLTELEDSGGKAKKSMDGVGKGVAAIGGAAPAAAIGGLVTSMEDYNRTLARLNTNAQMAGMSMGDVEDAFASMQLVSGDAESSVEGVSNLIAAGFDPTQILSATEAISGAALKWSDTLNVEGLSDAVQETISGGKSIGMFDELLSRSGVNIDKFNEGLKKSAKSGKEQEYVLKQLTDLGLGSYLDKHKELNPEVVKQQESQQQMTDALADLSLTLTPLVTDVANFTTKIIEWANENPKLAQGLAVGAAAIGGLVTVLAIAIPVISGVAVAFGALNTMLIPIIAIVLGVAAAIAAIILVIQNWGTITDWISDKWSQFMDWISEKIASFVVDFTKWFTEMKENAVNKFTELKDGATEKITGLVQKGVELVTSFKEKVVDKANELKTNFVNKVTELKDNAINRFNDLKNKVGDTVSQFKTNIVNKANEIKTDFVNKVTELKDNAVNRFNDLRTKAGDTINQFKSNVVGKITELKNDFVNRVNELKDNAVNRFNDLRSKATDVISQFKSNVVGKVSELKTEFVNKANEIKDGAISKFNNLRDKAGEVMSQAKSKILKPIEEAKTKISGIIEDIKGFFSNMKLKIPKIEMPKLPKFSLNGEFSLNPPSVPTISVDWFAKGGIMTRPTVFGRNGNSVMAGGEAGPEAILPLNEKTLGQIGKAIVETMGSGKGGDTNINIHSSDDANAIAAATERVLRRMAFRYQG